VPYISKLLKNAQLFYTKVPIGVLLLLVFNSLLAILNFTAGDAIEFTEDGGLNGPEDKKNPTSKVCSSQLPFSLFFFAIISHPIIIIFVYIVG
jgi:hypothetical protein